MMERERGRSDAQMSIDFLVGMTVFAGALFFVFQFMSGTILPFATSADETAVTVERTGDKVYYDRLTTEEKGVIDNITYFWDSGDVVSEDYILNDVGLDPDKHGLNITVVTEEINSEEVVEINESGLTSTGSNREELKVGDPPPDGGTSVTRASRVGYVTETGGENPETVVVKLRMW